VKRLLVATIGSACLTILLSGCSFTDRLVEPLELRRDVKMTPAEARDDLARQGDDLEGVLGGQWENQDNFLASGCADGKGFYYYGGRVRLEPISDMAVAAEQVAAWWEQRGYTVKHQVFRKDHLLRGVAPNGLTVDLNLADGRTYFSTDGTCLPGDWAAILREDGRNHRNDIVRTPTPSPTPSPTS
jgi:hypothetical protein